MNLPNKLTLARIALVPIFVLFLITFQFPIHTLIALLIFALASFTDHLDGAIARKHNLITNFGKFLDPLADKILVLSALCCFVALDWINAWFLIAILARDFMVDGIRLLSAQSGKVVAANLWGKLKTVTQMAAILVILILQFVQEIITLVNPVAAFSTAPVFYWIGTILIAIATFFTLLSGAIYLQKGWGFFRHSM